MGNKNRKKTTEFLSRLLEQDLLSGLGKYWAKEVVLNAYTNNVRRVDYMQYIPNGATFASEIENGYFINYEIKSCKADVYSGNGLNFFSEKNYIVTTMDCYKDILADVSDNTLERFINNELDKHRDYPIHANWGILIAVPDHRGYGGERITQTLLNEFENPTPLPDDYSTVGWRLGKIDIGIKHQGFSSISKFERLFCMLRAAQRNN